MKGSVLDKINEKGQAGIKSIKGQAGTESMKKVRLG